LVGVFINLPSKENPKEFTNQRIAAINEGNGFGEVALQDENCKRTATIKADDNIDCYLAFMSN
jgi:hypothetical protein